MAFIPHMWHKGAEPWELIPIATLPTTTEWTVGMALAFDTGGYNPAAASSKPNYICMQHAQSVTPGEQVYAERVRAETIYETETETSFTPVIGLKYQLSSDGTKLSSTTSDGVAEVVSFEGNKVRVRFPD